MVLPGGKVPLMRGIVSGLARKTSSKPVVDGIYTGVVQKPQVKIGSDIKKVKASATMNSVGQFGGMTSPEGQGDGRR